MDDPSAAAVASILAFIDSELEQLDEDDQAVVLQRLLAELHTCEIKTHEK
jgi:hypothetical protein